MRKILISLILLFSPATQAYEVDMKVLMSEFNAALNAPHKCSLENFKGLLSKAHEIYVWARFANSVEQLDILNNLYKEVAITEQARLSEERQISYEDIVNSLTFWYRQNCPVRNVNAKE
jgi:hypothetical protein